jgi:hypothetical protein
MAGATPQVKVYYNVSYGMLVANGKESQRL